MEYENYQNELLNKIDNKEKLTEKELKFIAYDCEIEREEGENRRWSRGVTSISKLGDRIFALDWEEGLTEMQPNEFYEQPYEVEKKEYEKIIKVIEWVAIEK